jgi:hypothetical protein
MKTLVTTTVFALAMLLMNSCCYNSEVETHYKATWYIECATGPILSASYGGSNLTPEFDGNLCKFDISNTRDNTVLIIETIGAIDTITFTTSESSRRYQGATACKDQMIVERTFPVITQSTATTVIYDYTVKSPQANDEKQIVFRLVP